MKRNCPNCGYSCNENDAYCSMCGTKLPYIQEIEEVDETEAENSSDATLDNMNIFISDDKEDKKDNPLIFNSKTLDNSLTNFIIAMVLVSLIMCASLYLVIQNQNSKKLEMRFKNMVTNPALIPELKEPSDILEFRSNLKNCEEFLLLYLKYSNDSQEKKEQVFISYLKEMEKMPHITNENLFANGSDNCSAIVTDSQMQSCTKRINSYFNNIGISAYPDLKSIYLYPNYKFIQHKYSKYLSYQMHKYIRLKAKYNKPTRVGLNLQMSPKKIADKIYDFEKLYTQVTDVYIRDEILKSIYYDFRAFIFTPSIYATTTQEMTKEFKNAYKYFISLRKNSQLRPMLMSYMDKMRAYNEENFINDYPYKMFEDTFSDNVENSMLSDIFVQLRKTAFAKDSSSDFSFVYNISNSSWKEFDKSTPLSQGEFLFSVPDENNNISVYNNTFSNIQELNIPKYAKLFMTNGNLYTFNSDRLSLHKIVFNGRVFVLQQLNLSDATTIFPGIQVINVDSYQNYNIYLDKYNSKAAYIILSRYSQGFDGYKLTALKGQISLQSLPNMFTVASDEDVVISFHHASVNPNETSDNTPTYRIIVKSLNSENENTVVNYDEQTAQQDDTEIHNPTIMPKIINNQNHTIEEIDSTDNLVSPPRQSIEPPDED